MALFEYRLILPNFSLLLKLQYKRLCQAKVMLLATLEVMVMNEGWLTMYNTQLQHAKPAGDCHTLRWT